MRSVLSNVGFFSFCCLLLFPAFPLHDCHTFFFAVLFQLLRCFDSYIMRCWLNDHKLHPRKNNNKNHRKIFLSLVLSIVSSLWSQTWPLLMTIWMVKRPRPVFKKGDIFSPQNQNENQQNIAFHCLERSAAPLFMSLNLRSPFSKVFSIVAIFQWFRNFHLKSFKITFSNKKKISKFSSKFKSPPRLNTMTKRKLAHKHTYWTVYVCFEIRSGHTIATRGPTTGET